ncbi:hypothetical protein AOLI_G00192040 [Acnodon oligacanthus]
MEDGVYDDVGSFELSEMDREERVEMMVDIYVSADAARAQENNTQRKTKARQTGRFWKKDEPNDANDGEDCAVSTTTAEHGWRTWNDISCSVRENWVCEFNTAKCH